MFYKLEYNDISHKLLINSEFFLTAERNPEICMEETEVHQISIYYTPSKEL